jgi:hypothetical protein
MKGMVMAARAAARAIRKRAGRDRAGMRARRINSPEQVNPAGPRRPDRRVKDYNVGVCRRKCVATTCSGDGRLVIFRVRAVTGRY